MRVGDPRWLEKEEGTSSTVDARQFTGPATRSWYGHGMGRCRGARLWAQLAVARSSMQGRAVRGTRLNSGEVDTRHAAMRASALRALHVLGL